MNRGRTSTARRIPGAGIIHSLLAALVLPIWLLTLAAWCVQLAGLAAVQNVQGRHFVQFDWFVTAFEVVVLLIMPFHLLARRSTPGIVALKAVVTVLEILRTNVWNDARLGRATSGQNFVQIDSLTNPGLTASTARVNTLFSGYLITSFFNCLLLIALGSLPAYSGQDVEYLSGKARQEADRRELSPHNNGNHYHADPEQHATFPTTTTTAPATERAQTRL